MTAAVYAAMTALPGDVVGVRSSTLDAAAAAARRHQLGLDQSIPQRFLSWFGGVLHGNLATSSQSGIPVSSMLPMPLKNSVTLAISALVIGFVVGIAAGAIAGYAKGRAADNSISAVGVMIMACPEFILATVLALLLGRVLNLFPTVSLAPIGESVLADPMALGLPVTTLALMCAATVSRSVRGVVARERGMPYVAAATMSGISPGRILFQHILPGCVAPVAQAAAVLVPTTFGGAVVVEKVFGFPGIGSLFVDSVASRDIPVAMAVALVLIGVSTIAYAIADILGDHRDVPA